MAFIESIRKALTTTSPGWEPIMKESTRPLYGGQQQPQYAMNETAGTPGEGGDRGSPETPGDGGGDMSLGLGNLLVEMESQIEYSAQSAQWPGMREKWLLDVEAAVSESGFSGQWIGQRDKGGQGNGRT